VPYAYASQSGMQMYASGNPTSFPYDGNLDHHLYDQGYGSDNGIHGPTGVMEYEYTCCKHDSEHLNVGEYCADM
jgi:hypothetical protein